jgi:hypothetical protein
MYIISDLRMWSCSMCKLSSNEVTPSSVGDGFLLSRGEPWDNLHDLGLFLRTLLQQNAKKYIHFNVLNITTLWILTCLHNILRKSILLWVKILEAVQLRNKWMWKHTYQKLNTNRIFWFVIMVFDYNYHNSGHYPMFSLLFKIQCFGDWILYLPSGGTYSVGFKRYSQPLSPHTSNNTNWDG